MIETILIAASIYLQLLNLFGINTLFS